MAAQDIGVVYVHVEPSGKGFGKSIEGDIGDAVSKASRKGSNTLISKIVGAFGKIGKVGTGAIATITGGITALAAKGGFTRALNIENAQAKLKGLGHDSASVTEIMNDALASVKGTAFGLGDAATVAASLSASGVKEGGQLTKVLKTVADTAQISGRSLTDIGTIFGSVAARGKLQGDDMLQLLSSGIPVLQMLGKHLNKTSAEVSDMVSDGKIDFQTFADAMQEGLGGAALSAGTTFTGALANVKAALSRLGETAATPVIDGLRGLFNQAIPLIDTFTAAVTPTLQKVGAALQQGLENAIPATQAKLKNLGDTISNIPGFQMLASATASLKSQLTGLWNAITSLIGGLNNGGEAATMFSTTAGSLAGVVASVAQALSNAAGWAKTFVNTFIETGALQPFLESLTGVISGLGSLVSGLAAAVSQAFGFNDSARTASSAAQSFAGLLNTLTGVLMTVGGWLQSVGQWAQQNGALVSGALKAITIALLAVKGWDIVSAGLKTVSGGLKAISATASGVEKTATAAFDLIGKISDAGSVAGGLKQLAGSFNIVKTAQSAWSAVTKAATAVQLAFSAALDANPIGMLVVAIGAVVAALAWFFTQTNTGRQMWASFTSFLSSAWQATVGKVTSIGQTIVTFFTSTLPSAIQGVGQWFQQLPGNIASWLAGAASAIASWAVSLGQSALQAGQQFLTNLANAIMNLPETIAYWLGYTVTSIALYAVAFGAQALQMGMQFVQNVGTFLAQLPGNVAAWLASTAASIGAWVSSTAMQALQMGTQFLQNVGTFLTQLPGNVASWLAGAVASASAWVSNMASQAIQAGSRFLTSVSTFLSELPGRIGSWLSATISSVASWASQMGSKALQAGNQFVQNIVSTLSSLPGRMLSIGANIVNGIVSGIQSKIGSIASSLLSGVNDAISAVKSKLGIHSPSRLMRDEVGVMIGRGMALGIDDSAAVVDRSMDSLVSSMSLDGTDWSKTGRLNVTTATPSDSDRLLETVIGRMDTLIEAVETATADDRPFTQRDFARLVRSVA